VTTAQPLIAATKMAIPPGRVMASARDSLDTVMIAPTRLAASSATVQAATASQ
jgi:hypothetical protein